MGYFAEYDQYDGLGLAGLVRQGEVSEEELVEEAIIRIEMLNPQLNAVIYRMYDRARAAARAGIPDGPFRGVPFLLKDILVDCAGVATTRSCRLHRNIVATHDSEMYSRFQQAGLITLGKTNLPEYGLTPYTEPALYGPTRNPWDLARSSGGSSGGSAAAVASRMVPMAHGNDAGGSIRAPASCCGLFGLKPSRGRNPTGPDMGEIWYGLACDHTMTRTVRDSAALLDITAGPDAGAPYCAPPPQRSFLRHATCDPRPLRIAYSAEPLLPSSLHPDCLHALEDSVTLCKDLGHEMIEARPTIDGPKFANAFFTIVCCVTSSDIREAECLAGRKARAFDYEPTTWAIGLLGRQHTADDLSEALRFLGSCSRSLGQFFERYDVFLSPTLSQPPILTGSLQPAPKERMALKLLGSMNAGWLLNSAVDLDAMAEQAFEYVPNLPPFNASGQPAASIPLYWNAEGLPIGMQIAARYGEEATLFSLAGQLERARPWVGREPPVNYWETRRQAGK